MGILYKRWKLPYFPFNIWGKKKSKHLCDQSCYSKQIIKIMKLLKYSERTKNTWWCNMACKSLIFFTFAKLYKETSTKRAAKVSFPFKASIATIRAWLFLQYSFTSQLYKFIYAYYELSRNTAHFFESKSSLNIWI